MLQEIHVQMAYAQHALADTSSTTDRATSSGSLQALVFVLILRTLPVSLSAHLANQALSRIPELVLQRLPALHVMAWMEPFSAKRVD